jgi:hypothetical protein
MQKVYSLNFQTRKSQLRGVASSAAENALYFGVQTAGRFQHTVVYTFENVVVVWNYVENIVVTVIKTGH